MNGMRKWSNETLGQSVRQCPNGVFILGSDRKFACTQVYQLWDGNTSDIWGCDRVSCFLSVYTKSVLNSAHPLRGSHTYPLITVLPLWYKFRDVFSNTYFKEMDHRKTYSKIWIKFWEGRLRRPINHHRVIWTVAGHDDRTKRAHWIISSSQTCYVEGYTCMLYYFSTNDARIVLYSISEERRWDVVHV